MFAFFPRINEKVITITAGKQSTVNNLNAISSNWTAKLLKDRIT